MTDSLFILFSIQENFVDVTTDDHSNDDLLLNFSISRSADSQTALNSIVDVSKNNDSRIANEDVMDFKQTFDGGAE